MTLLPLIVRAWRSLLRHRALSAAIVAVLGIGMGATVALFAIVNALVLRPLPYPDAAQLVQVWSELPASQLTEALVSYPRYAIYAGQSTTLSSLGALWKQDFSVTGRGESVRRPGALVSVSLFATVGITPAQGRLFRPGEDQPGAPPVAVISAAFWRSHFGSAPEVIGSAVTIDGRPSTIIGIVDAPMVFARSCCDLFVPRVSEPDTLSRRAIDRGASYLTVIGRMRPDTAVSAVTQDLRAISHRYGADRPDNIDARYEPRVVPLATQVLGGAQDTLLMLLVAGGLVFVTAAANVGGLLLLRHLARADEFAVQRALGARRRDLVVPLLAEALILAMAAVAVAFAAATATLRVAHVTFASVLPHWNISFADPNVILMGAALVGVACLGAALVPALSMALGSGGRSLAPASRSAAPRPRELSGLTIFAVTQLALSFALLSTAIDLSRSMWQLQRVELGYDPSDVLTAQVAPHPGKYPTLDAQSRFYRALRERLRQLPGVVDAGTAQVLPTIEDQRIPYRIDGRPAPKPEEHPIAQFRFVDSGYFTTLAVPLIRGRVFTDADTPDGAPVAIISATIARREFGERDPLGEQIVLATTPPRRIIGVVPDVRELGPALPPEPGVYVPLQQMFVPKLPPMYIAVRAHAGIDVTESVRRAALSVDADQPLARVRAMAEVVGDGLAVPRLRAMIATVFAAIGLLLAGIGVYSASAHAGVRRVKEFAMRLALGASHGTVVALMVRSVAGVTAAGLVAGVLAMVGVNRLIAAYLGDILAVTPSTLAAAAAVLTVLAALATLMPAVRVFRMDPAQSLRTP